MSSLALASGASAADAGALESSTCGESFTQYTVPAGVTVMQVTAEGGHGGTEDHAADGGPGAVADAPFSVNPGDVVVAAVGCYGEGHGGWGYLGYRGGEHGVADSDAAYDGGGGGGASMVTLNGSLIMVAAGGGGGGGEGFSGSGGGDGGWGGIPAGEAGSDGDGGGAGRSASGGCGGCANSVEEKHGGGSSTGSGGGGVGGGGGGLLSGGGGEGGNIGGGRGGGGGSGTSFIAPGVTSMSFAHSTRTRDGAVTVSWGGVPGAEMIETTTTITSSANPSVETQAVAFTASVTDESGAPVMAGDVQFDVGGNHLGGPVAVHDGVAVSPAVNDIAVGSATVTASFMGTAELTSSTASLQQEVTATTTPSPTTPPTTAPEPVVPPATDASEPQLAASGYSVDDTGGWIALGLLVAGCVALGLSRRRSTTERHRAAGTENRES